MNRLLPLDIAPDLTLTIGSQSTRVTPQLGLRLAESLLRVSVREIAREERERAEHRPCRAPRNRKTAA